LKSV
jgi:hypothetical protein